MAGKAGSSSSPRNFVVHASEKIVVPNQHAPQAVSGQRRPGSNEDSERVPSTRETTSARTGSQLENGEAGFVRAAIDRVNRGFGCIDGPTLSTRPASQGRATHGSPLFVDCGARR